MMKKRILRKFANPGKKPNPKNGIFCAEQVKYVVRTVVKNIDHRRTLILYIYDKEKVQAGDFTPRWTMFQGKEDYITLCNDEKGTRWQQSMFDNLGKNYYFRSKCSFYSQGDEDRVTRYCHHDMLKGFDSLSKVQYSLLCKRQKANKLKGQKKIVDRMKPVKSLPRDIKGFMYRETLPHYIFYDYARGKPPLNAYCTGCKHEVSITEAKHNGKGICPRCKRSITYKSRGRRGTIADRSTAQVIQRISENELVIRTMKSYCHFRKSDTAEFNVYENARLFLRWEGNKIVNRESYYYCYVRDRITPWHKGDRPIFNQWRYNFEADCTGYLYCRNLDCELKGTPWQYSALKEYYKGDPSPLYAGRYLSEYLRYPMLEYLVKLKLNRLATYVVYGDADGSYFHDDNVLNSHGKTVTDVLGIGKKYVPFVQSIDPGAKQLTMIKAFLRENIEPNMELMKWCSENNVGKEDLITVPLRFMTPHKLMRYASEQFAAHRKKSYFSVGYYSMGDLLSDYKDYLCMCEALEHDMKSSFVLFPNNLKAEHDRVNDMSQEETSKAYDRIIAKMFEKLQDRYGYTKLGLIIVPPHSAKEITREGDQLHHCVGRYVKDVVQNNCIILFIREASSPQKPFCTVEIQDGDVVQARIQNNASPPPKVQKFIKLWKKNVLYASALQQAA